MASGNAIRGGSRVGAGGPMGEAERGESAPRLRISFWCSNGHETQPNFAHDAQVPDT
ncbi:RNA polymerase-binding protein RbpA, partial [Streptomyces sp. SID7803]|nr:RNA polymerase-binding protein RbpA [Streptomyces sp. SID7803]